MVVFRLALVALVLLMAGPVVALLLAVAPADVIAAFQSDAVHNAAATSLAASLAALAIATVLGVPAGFALAHAPGRVRTPVLFTLALPLAFPPVTSGIILLHSFGTASPLGTLLARRGITFIDSLAGVTLAEFFVSGSFVVIASAAAFAFVDPALEESAATLGASRALIFRRIALPLALPGIVAGMLLAWLRSLGEYGATSIVAYHPASLSIYIDVALSANGLHAALPLSYAFVVFAALIVAAQWIVRRRLSA